MTCKSCNAPTAPGWDNRPMDLCSKCSKQLEKKWRDSHCEEKIPNDKKETEYFTHICKSCLTPAFQPPRKGIFGISVNQTYCAQCNRDALIPVKTPKGIELMKRIGYTEI